MSVDSYFDVAGYFNSEAGRLRKLRPNINKSVLIKGTVESKTTIIEDWKSELAMFTDASINKDAWRGEFKIDSAKNVITYITSNEKIPVKRLEITTSKSVITSIKIYKQTTNYLYTSSDKLEYYPDSLYKITSQQKVKLLEQKNYQIIGKFK